MFALSIALLALALVAAKFTWSGDAGGALGGPVAIVAACLAVISMTVYLRRARARRGATKPN